MKHLSLSLVTLLLGISAFAQQTWQIDNAHSNIRFEVGWQDFSMRTGEFKVFEGEIVTDSWEDLSDATFSLNVDPNSIDVIAERLNEHLRSADFLDTEQYPEISFNATGATALSDSTYLVTGDMLMYGVEREQEVFVEVKGHKEEERNDLLGLQVTFTFNKNDYGMDWGAPRLGENVTVVGHLLYQSRNEEEG